MTKAMALVAAAGLAMLAHAAEVKTPGVSITIYSSAEPGGISADMYRPVQGPYQYQRPEVPGYAMVREDRTVTLGQGLSQLKLTDVAALIDPTTVSFTSLTDPAGTSVLDQNFQFDLVSNEKLLQRYIDKEILAVNANGNEVQRVRGTLLSAQAGQLVLQDAKGTLFTMNGYTGIELPALPEGLITRPTLVWNVNAGVGGEHLARVSYETQGTTWWADYNLTYKDGADENTGTLDVAAWVSIINQCGTSFENAQLKLVAGTVNRAQPDSRGRAQYAMPAARAMEKADNLGFQEKSFFEYHLYTLGRPVDLPQNSTKQVELFPTARNVPVEKVLIYDGAAGFHWWGDGAALDANLGVPVKPDVDVFLRFVNSEKEGMGMPLPAGRIRVSKVDEADGAVEFIGEDVIRHTPRDEKVLIRMGKSFDVVGERVQKEFSIDHARRWMTETIKVEVRNRKQEPVRVLVQERMYRWTNWQFDGQAPAHEKLDARTVHFPVQLNAGESKSITYTVRYTW